MNCRGNSPAVNGVPDEVVEELVVEELVDVVVGVDEVDVGEVLEATTDGGGGVPPAFAK